MKPSVAKHTDLLHTLPCMICGLKPGSTHHVMGGSIVERIGVRGTRKHSDWLQLPLCHHHHQGQFGIHKMGVRSWESAFGRQADMVDQLCGLLQLNLWELAEEQKANRKRSAQTSTKILPRRHA